LGHEISIIGHVSQRCVWHTSRTFLADQCQILFVLDVVLLQQIYCSADLGEEEGKLDIVHLSASLLKYFVDTC